MKPDIKKTGLFFGTFNPIHIGHVILANYFLEHSDLEALWFVVTPRSPFKKKKTLLDDHQRLYMVRLACEDYPGMQASDIEFKLPQPNYTVYTLAQLSEQFPNRQFALLMGEDNLNGLHKWKNYEAILEHYPIYVYPRITSTEVNPASKDHPNVHRVEAPVIELSATTIRRDLGEGKNVRPYLPPAVWKYLDEMNFYR